MTEPPSTDEGRGPRGRERPDAGATEPDERFEQPQDPVSALVHGVRLWKALARLSGHGVPGTAEVRVGKFVLEDVLGEGGMSVVFAARDPELGQSVALKMLKPRMEREQRERLLREGQALARIKSDHVVRVLEISRHQGATVLVIERVHGVSLDRWLTQHKPDLDGILDLMTQAGRGLAEAHRVALVHRDVKPQNIMVADGAIGGRGGPPRVYMVDFGLVSVDVFDPSGAEEASPGDRLTATGALVGTLYYMAPEQANQSLTDARTDIYGFCVVLYEAVFGRRPHPDGAKDDVLTAIRSGVLTTPPLRSRAHRQLWAVLRRGLARDPVDRYPSMEALLVDLERIRRRRDRATRWALGFGAGAAVLAAGLAGAAMVPSEAEANQTACLDLGHELTAAMTIEQGADARLSAKLDAYRGRWGQAWASSCEAEYVPAIRAQRGDGQAATRGCLEEGQRAIKADLKLLQRASAAEQAMIREGLRLGEFPAIDACSRAGRLLAVIRPVDEGAAARLQTAIDNARHSILIDDQDAAAAALHEVIVAAGEANDRPALARAEFVLARMLRLGGSGDAESLLAHLGAAEDAAITAGDDVQVLRVLLERARMHALVEGSASRGRDALRRAHAWLERVVETLSDDEKRGLRATLLDVEGLVEYADHKYDDAVRLHRAALTALGSPRAGDFEDHVDQATILINLGRAVSASGRSDEGLKITQDAVQQEIALFGAAHSELVEAITGIAIDLSDAEQMKEALPYARMAVELARDGRRAVAPRQVLAQVLLSDEQYAEAEREAREAAQVATKAGMFPEAVHAEVILGAAMFGDRIEACEPTLEHFEGLVRQVMGREHQERDELLAAVLPARMQIAFRCRRHELVLADFEAAWSVVTHPEDRLDMLRVKGQALAALGRREESIAALREGLAGEGGVPTIRRDATLALADLLAVEGNQRNDACTLVRKLPPDDDEVRAWIEQQCR